MHLIRFAHRLFHHLFLPITPHRIQKLPDTITLHKRRQIHQRQTDAVIGHAVLERGGTRQTPSHVRQTSTQTTRLGIVVRSNLLATIGRPDQILARCTTLSDFSGNFHVHQPGPKDLERTALVLGT